MNKDLVSVIMPAYNAEKFIAESIQSVINQTHQNWELLVVDDGSTDRTKDIITNFCDADARIKYYWQLNSKPGKARNLALKYAQGNFTAFLDADDIWFANKLELQLHMISENNADLVFSDAYVFSKNINDNLGQMHAGNGFFAGNNGLKAFLEINRIPLLTVVAKTAILRNVGGFTESPLITHAEDYHLWLKLLLNGYVLFGSGLILAGYREHDASFSNVDKLSVSKVVEAFEDLKKAFPGYALIINAYLKKWFEKYQSIGYREDYSAVIKKNCNYVGKPGYNLIFQTLYLICGFNITRTLMNRFINRPGSFYF